MRHFMNLYLKGYQKFNKSKLKLKLLLGKYKSVQLWTVLFLIPLEVQGHTVPHWKGLITVKYEPRGLKCGRTLNICQAFLKGTNLLHKRGLCPFPMASTVHIWKTRKPALWVFLAPMEGLTKFLSSLYHAWQLLLSKFFNLVKLEFCPPGPAGAPWGSGVKFE